MQFLAHTLENGRELALLHLLDVLEAALTIVVLIVAFKEPAVGSRWFGKVERVLKRAAKRPAASLLLLVLLALAVRAAALPILPVPIPAIHDEFGYLLSADTFLHGRLTNPPHPMWKHFESFHINQQPTYQSMYPPAQALALAAGTLVGGHPFFGVCATLAFMSAAICWALRGFVPAGWAFLGGVIAMLRYGVYSYWAGSYCGGAVAALGGALVFGAVHRLIRYQRIRDSVWLAVGLALMANSRPYEGFVLGAIALLVMLVWSARNRSVPKRVLWLQVALPAAVLLVLCGAAMGCYFARVTGSPLKMPYQLNRETYAVAPYFLFQSPYPQPQYRHVELKKYYVDFEYRLYEEERELASGTAAAVRKVLRAWLFFFGVALTLPLIMFPRLVRDRRFLVVLIATASFIPVVLPETFWIPHYAAPFTVLFVAVIIQCMRHLRVWRPRGRKVGLAMVRLLPVVVVAMLLVRSIPAVGGLPMPPLHMTWYSSRPADRSRLEVSQKLESLPGKHLVIVRYSPDHNVWNEWVYNDADIDGSKVVWAREMSETENEELLRYFKDKARLATRTGSTSSRTETIPSLRCPCNSSPTPCPTVLKSSPNATRRPIRPPWASSSRPAPATKRTTSPA